jgi:hypothetical protein
MDERELAIKVVYATLTASINWRRNERRELLAEMGHSYDEWAVYQARHGGSEMVDVEALVARLFTGGAPQTYGERLAQIGLEVVGLLPRPS